MKPERRPQEPPAVAIVGAGFSGLLTAIHLLRRDPAVRVRLIERTARFGLGRAYGTSNPDHLLNVRASNMSAFADQPDHFQAWRGCSGDAFVSRGRYGEYLRGLLADELGNPAHAARLMMEAAETVAAERAGPGWRLRLRDGRRLYADAVVLALGFLPGAFPAGVTIDDAPGQALVADPWATDLTQVAEGHILLLGAGLTMVDVALSLASPNRRLTALSRRGLLPLRHAPAAPSPAPPGFALSNPAAALRALRRHADAVGWRSAVDSVRPVTAELWRSWTLDDRRRFLRHGRPWWDIHRHRMAPPVADRLQEMRARGQLTVLAGRLEALRGRSGTVEAVIRRRGAQGCILAPFAAVVNCASPHGDPRHAHEGVVADLRERGLLRADALGLGLDIDADLRVIGAEGQPSPGLFAVGPLTRGGRWEAVAVPDLRNQTAEAAAAVLAWLRRPDGTDPRARRKSSV